MLPLVEARRGGSAVGLPSYAWDNRLRNYVDLTTGRMVKREFVTNLLRDVVKGSEGRLSTLGELYANKALTSRQFYELMTREIKLTMNTATALASGGWQNVSQSAWGRNGALCREQYAYLRDFMGAVERGELSAAQIMARAKLYGNTAYGRYWEIEQAAQQARGMQRMRIQTVGDDRTCPQCIEEARRGWQPIGTWHVPLHAACRCNEIHGQ